MEAIQVEIILKTGQRWKFECFSFERVQGGYEFTSYPPERGFKTVRLVSTEVIGALTITGPEPMLKDLEMPPLATYVGGDPQKAGPQTTLSMANRARAGARPVRDREAPPGMGRPLSVATEFNEHGEAREIPVNAGMMNPG